MKKSIIAAALAATVAAPAFAEWTESKYAHETYYSATPAVNAPDTESLSLYSRIGEGCEIQPMLVIVSDSTSIPKSGEFPIRYRFDRNEVQYEKVPFKSSLSKDGQSTFIYFHLPSEDSFINDVMSGNSLLIGIDSPKSDATSKFSLKGSSNAIGSILSDCSKEIAVDPWSEEETTEWSENQSEVEWGV